MPVLRDKEKRSVLRKKLYGNLSEGGVAIPEAIKTLRKILAQDQKTFSEFVGISVSALRRVEQGNDNVELATIYKIFKKFSLVLKVHSSD